MRKYNNDIAKRYEAMFILHSLGDTLGFRSGQGENIINSTYYTIDSVNEFVYKFIELGGINGIDISDWVASDDTIFHLATAKAMLKYNGKLDKKFISITKDEIIKHYNFIIGEVKNNIRSRNIGITTLLSINKYTEKTDASHLPYDVSSGGNGCAMKMLCVGACLYGEKKRDELINVSIRIGKMTHNSPIGFLGGFVTALFTAYAIEGINIQEWPNKMIKLLQSKKIKKHIKFNYDDDGDGDGDSGDSLNQINDYLEFIKIWKKYIESRFNNNKLIKDKSHTNLMLRVKYYHSLMVVDTKAIRIGESGYGVGIMAYDGLLDCDGKWEKLVFYTALHPGDADTVCAVAGGLYGMYYGYGDVPMKFISQMEYGDKLKKIAMKIYKKYWIG
jgi:ADP-ribosylglycohydrolase